MYQRGRVSRTQYCVLLTRPRCRLFLKTSAKLKSQCRNQAVVEFRIEFNKILNSLKHEPHCLNEQSCTILNVKASLFTFTVNHLNASVSLLKITWYFTLQIRSMLPRCYSSFNYRTVSSNRNSQNWTFRWHHGCSGLKA